MFTQAGGGGSQKWMSSAFLDRFSTLLFETGSPTEPRHFWQTKWPVRPWDLAVSALPPPRAGISGVLVTPGFCEDSRDLRCSSSHNVLLTHWAMVSSGATFYYSWSSLPCRTDRAPVLQLSVGWGERSSHHLCECPDASAWAIWW